MKHKDGIAQSWESAQPELRNYVFEVVDSVRSLLLPAEFVGAYLHGSLAMGSFYHPKSDLDLIFVVRNPIPQELRRRIALEFCDQSDKRPLVGDIESSVLLLSETANFHHPLPFELHYGESHKQAIRDNSIDFISTNRDPDLAVYCTTIRHNGVCLMGETIDEVFSPVPVEFYRQSILDNLDWILDGENILESPFYSVLNCCRVLFLNENGWDKILNKEQGGIWALERLPKVYAGVIGQALSCYRSCEPVEPAVRRTDGHEWDAKALIDFRDFVAECRNRALPQV